MKREKGKLIRFQKINMATDMKLLFKSKVNVFRIFVQLRLLMKKKKNLKSKEHNISTFK